MLVAAPCMSGAWMGVRRADATEHTRTVRRGEVRRGECRLCDSAGTPVAVEQRAEGWGRICFCRRLSECLWPSPRRSSRLRVVTPGVSQRAADESKQTIGVKLRRTTIGHGWTRTEREAETNELRRRTKRKVQTRLAMHRLTH